MHRGKISFALVVTMLVMAATVALAAPVTRSGSDYDGDIPTDCPIFEVSGDDLHVACTESDVRSDNARIRYRFLKEYGGIKAPATVSADIDVVSGPSDCYRVRWMNPVRTLRIKIMNTHPMCEVVIHSVTWEQP